MLYINVCREARVSQWAGEGAWMNEETYLHVQISFWQPSADRQQLCDSWTCFLAVPETEAHKARLSTDSVPSFQRAQKKEQGCHTCMFSILFQSRRIEQHRPSLCKLLPGAQQASLSHPGRRQRWQGFSTRLKEDMSSSWSPIKQAVCVHTRNPGSRNPSQPHTIGIIFLTDQESQLDVGIGFLCGSCFLTKFPADQRNMGSILSAAEHCQLCILYVLRGSTGTQNPQNHIPAMTPLKPHWPGGQTCIPLLWSDCLLLPPSSQENTLLFAIGGSRSHWNKLNLHLVTPGLRGPDDEQLKIHFLERWQRKKRQRTLSFPKQGMFQFVLSREMLWTTFTTGFLKQTFKTWQHVCLQVKSHGAVYVNWTPHVPLPALKHKWACSPPWTLIHFA